jgi:hypothetical protein
MPELNYKASNIARAEREYGLNFFKEMDLLLGDPTTGSISSLMFILVSGGVSEEEADALIEKVGITEACAIAGEALKGSGFLAKVLADPAIQKELEKVQAVQSAEISQNSGEAMKA